jgi:hypothetical protein
MSRSSRISALFKEGGFLGHFYVGQLLQIGFAGQCWTLAAVSAGAVLVGSVMDHTLFLNGRSVGLLEHPAIWAFFGLQIALPLCMRQSVRNLVRSRKLLDGPPQLQRVAGATTINRVIESIRLRNNSGRFVAAIFYCVGLVAFVWNTYQNQLPGIIVPYDFWDSANHQWGYWITRLYKLYLFVGLLPYIALVHFAVLSAALQVLRERRTRGELRLQPFHPDGTGGFGFVPRLVTTPIAVTLMFAAIPVAGAIHVHRAADVTPVMGVILIVGGALIAYLLPIFYLRTDILAMKRDTLGRLRSLQQTYANVDPSSGFDFEALRRGSEALEYFDKVCARVTSISSYPHLPRMAKYIGLALTPTAASLAIKFYETLSPVIIPILGRS